MFFVKFGQSRATINVVDEEFCSELQCLNALRARLFDERLLGSRGIALRNGEYPVKLGSVNVVDDLINCY
jgi:hypothetical protein